jgi:hypothetical protein
MGRKMLGQKDEYRGHGEKIEGERSSIREAFCFCPTSFDNVFWCSWRREVAGTLRRAVRFHGFDVMAGEQHMECAYYFVNRGWFGWMGDFRCGAVWNELRWARTAEDCCSTLIEQQRTAALH